MQVGDMQRGAGRRECLGGGQRRGGRPEEVPAQGIRKPGPGPAPRTRPVSLQPFGRPPPHKAHFPCKLAADQLIPEP